MSIERYAMVTDRTAEDVELWERLRRKKWDDFNEEEKRVWERNIKGAYNDSDVNRVLIALYVILRDLFEAGYVTSWVGEDLKLIMPYNVWTASQLKFYLKCVADIRDALAQYPSTPPAPKYSGGLDYIEANNIEQICLDVDELITNMLKSRYFCGELYSGEV